MTPVRLEPATLRSRVKHSTTEPLRSLASLKSESTCEMINKIPGSRLLISSLPDSASRTHVESLGSLAMSPSLLEVLPAKLDIKRRKPGIL